MSEYYDLFNLALNMATLVVLVYATCVIIKNRKQR